MRNAQYMVLLAAGLACSVCAHSGAQSNAVPDHVIVRNARLRMTALLTTQKQPVILLENYGAVTVGESITVSNRFGVSVLEFGRMEAKFTPVWEVKSFAPAQQKHPVACCVVDKVRKPGLRDPFLPVEPSGSRAPAIP